MEYHAMDETMVAIIKMKLEQGMEIPEIARILPGDSEDLFLYKLLTYLESPVFLEVIQALTGTPDLDEDIRVRVVEVRVEI